MAVSSPLRILHILPTRSREYGGPVSVAEAMAEEATRQGAICNIYPPRGDEAGTKGVRALWCAVRRANIVHIHGLWNLHATVAAAAARWLGIPYVITPHGMLDNWARSRSWLKKQIFGYLFERRNLRRAATVHFLNSEECAEARNYGVQLHTSVLPNGVFVNQFADLPDKTTLSKAYPELEDKVVALFLGRLHPKKGFDLLIPALAHAITTCPQLHLLVAGPDQGGYRSELEAQIRELGLLSRVTFLGMVSGKNKLDALASADFFVLPSHQEGDSVAVKEALACGLPVLITPACHFPEVQQAGAGIVVPPNEQAWQEALCLLYKDKNSRIHMGQRACPLVQERYTWEKVVQQLLDIYRYASILRQGSEARDA
jgi:glycosyltransferase involved in cell wall biosynthesis